MAPVSSEGGRHCLVRRSVLQRSRPFAYCCRWEQCKRREGACLLRCRCALSLKRALTRLVPCQVFDRTCGNAVVGTIAGLSRGVFSLDWHQDKLLAVAGGDCAVRLFAVEDTDEESKGDDGEGTVVAAAVKSRRHRAGDSKDGEDESKTGGDSKAGDAEDKSKN